MSEKKPDGGPAFARPSGRGSDGDDESTYDQQGMSLRDYFAGQALCGLLPMFRNGAFVVEEMAQLSYELADAMLKERAK